MSEKRFKVCIDSNNGVGLLDNSIKLIFIKFTNKEDAVSCKDSLKYQCNLMNELYDENEQLKEENEKLVQNKCLSCELVNLQTREIDKLKDENEQLKQILENLDLNEKNDTVKMIDGKVFMRM